MSRRTGRRLILALAAVVILAALAIVASAALDRPVKVASGELTVPAPAGAVWDVVAGLDSYAEWNPVFVAARGQLAEGETLELDVVHADGERDRLSVEVTIVREGRKIRWTRRLLVPGLRDQEFEMLLEPQGTAQTIVRARTLFEGVLAPFAGSDGARQEVAAILEALRHRVEVADRAQR